MHVDVIATYADQGMDSLCQFCFMKIDGNAIVCVCVRDKIRIRTRTQIDKISNNITFIKW